MTPAQLLWLGSCFALGVFVVGFLIARPTIRLTRRSAWAVVLGMVNPFLYYLILLEGYDRLPAQIAQPLNFLWAIVYALLAVPILKQKLSWSVVGGILISYFGVVLLLTRGELTAFGTFDTIGIFLILVSTVLWAVYWLCQTRLDLPATQFMLMGFACGTPLIGIYCHMVDGLPALTLTNLSFGVWIGLFEMGVTYLIWQRALALSTQVASVGQLIFISPLISLGFIQFILGEPVHIFTLIALPIILLGVFVVRKSIS